MKRIVVKGATTVRIVSPVRLKSAGVKGSGKETGLRQITEDLKHYLQFPVDAWGSWSRWL